MNNALNAQLLQLANEAFVSLKKARKGKVATIVITNGTLGLPAEISVADGAGWKHGTPIVGTFTKEHADVLRAELLRLGVGKVNGKIQR